MINDGFHSYTYDAEGNITQVSGGGTTAQYSYDALNNRVRAVVNGTATEFVFNASGQRVSTWNGSTYAQIQGQYYWGSQPVAFYENGTLHFQHQNWLGTERVRTSYNGAVEGTYGSLPFGDGQTTSGSDADAYHFATLDHDSETDTDHAVFRQYNNSQGRWMSPDPYDGSYDSLNPESLNRYSYSANQPLSFIDPTGRLHCIIYVTCPMGNVSNDGTDPAGEFFFVDWVSAGSGSYGYSDSVWQSAMSDGPGGGNTIDDSTGIIYDAAGDPVGQTWASFSSAGNDIMLNGTVQIGQGSGAPSTGTKTLQLLKCASKTANQFSIAGFAGMTGENSGAAGAIGTAFLGNTFSGLVDTGTHIATGHFGAAYGDFALGGTAQGLPLGTSPAAKGIVGVTTDAAVGATLGAEMVEPVGWAKLAIDGLVFGGSVLSCLGN